MELDDWSSRWRAGRIAFNQPSVSDFLELYADRVWGQGPQRVLVPLCGKSLDMVYLAERGAEVVGVEFVEQGVREFFAERGLEPEREAGPPPRFRAGPYTLFAADFFTVGAEQAGPVDAVLDRAALVALDPPTRVRYAAHLRALLPAGATILLISLDYDQSEMEGPPFAVGEAEVGELFRDGFSVEQLDSREPDRERKFFSQLSSMREVAYAITRAA